MRDKPKNVKFLASVAITAPASACIDNRLVTSVTGTASGNISKVSVKVSDSPISTASPPPAGCEEATPNGAGQWDTILDAMGNAGHQALCEAMGNNAAKRYIVAWGEYMDGEEPAWVTASKTFWAWRSPEA
jgi:hypothetical protein